MAYSNNPLLPKARRFAVNLVLKEGITVSVAARKCGIHRSTLYRWLRKAQELHGRSGIPTISSRPHSHPKQLTETIVRRIVELRTTVRRCAGYIHALLKREGVIVSLASVSRVLARKDLLYAWHGQQGKQRRRRMSRPQVSAPGDLVQVDTIHFNEKWGKSKQKHYLYTLIDLKTRWVYAMGSDVINPAVSAYFVAEAQQYFPHSFKVIQTDNGQEFSDQFEQRLKRRGITQRRIRLGKKNDNAHIERFNRTVQDELLGRWPTSSTISLKLPEYLAFYNNERLHSGLQYKTPCSVLQRF